MSVSLTLGPKNLNQGLCRKASVQHLLCLLSHWIDLHRIAIHPDYQRRGIASQLLQWGLDRADSEKLVSYLNARSQARRLYEKGGFTVVERVPMPVPGLEVSDMLIMVRQAQLVRSG